MAVYRDYKEIRNIFHNVLNTAKDAFNTRRDMHATPYEEPVHDIRSAPASNVNYQINADQV